MEFLNDKNHKIYFGHWMDGFMDGHGKQIKQNGEMYEGEFKLSLRDGIGELTYHHEKLYGYRG